MGIKVILNQLTEKDRILIEIRKNQIQAIDKDTTYFSLRVLFGVFIIFYFSYKLNIINQNNLFTAFVVLVAVFVYLAWWMQQLGYWIQDCYDSFSNAIGNGEISRYRIGNY